MDHARAGFDGPIVSLQHVPLFAPCTSESPYGYTNAREVWAAFERKQTAITNEQERLRRTFLRPGDAVAGALETLLGAPLERCRLHILRRMGEYLAGDDLEDLPDGVAAARARSFLERAYQDFVASTPLEERVFKVLKDHDPKRPVAPGRAVKYTSEDGQVALAELPAAPVPATGLRLDRNPVNRSARIGFAAGRAGQADLAVFDRAGRRVTTLHAGPLAAGEHSVAWDASRVAPGVYFLRLAVGGETAAVKAVVTR